MKKILIIDDEKNILNSVAMYLGGHNFEVIKSMEGLQGINIAKEQKPDLILLDLVLPDMDGYLVCRALKESSGISDIPVIVFSAKCQKEDIKRASDCGASDFITKPFEPKNLLDVVNKYLEEK
ncbi:MAG: response regulator [Clostridia bacterium]|nr:response regulator [Clostridia bacterium]